MSNVRQRKHGAENTDADISTDESDDTQTDKSSWGVLSKFLLYVFFFGPMILIVGVVFFIDSPIEPVVYSLGKQPKLEGDLAPNKRLVEQGQRYYEGKLRGPESIVYRDGHIYTGTVDGKILRINHKKGTIKVLAKLGRQPCGLPETEHNCGRPLGIRLDQDGYLMVLDAYLGLYQINVATGDVSQLFPATMEVDQKPFRFLNDFDISQDGMIYFTDSSHFERRTFPYDFLEGTATGRLLMHNPMENTTETLLDDLHFANGVQLSEDGSFLLVGETTMCRIQKYHLSGPMKGLSEVFIDNLPGIVDNIRASSSGGFWAALGVCRYAGRLSFQDMLANYPGIRKQIAKMPMKHIAKLFTECVILLELSPEGKILRTLMDLHGEMFAHISEVEDHDGVLYLGSYKSPYIGVVDTRTKTAKKAKHK